MKRYFKVWWLMTSDAVQTVLAIRLGVFVFTFGKLFRFLTLLAFVYFLFSATQSVGGFNRTETLLFMVSFVTVSGVAQMLFREVYRFRGRVVSGALDFDLIHPINPLLRNLLGGFDVLDLITLPIYLWILAQLIHGSNFTLGQVLTYLLLVGNGLVVGAAFHIFILGLTAVYTDIDQGVLIYRDLEAMGRFPVDIYKEPLRTILTYLVPVAVIFTIPVKGLLGLVTPAGIVVSLVVGIIGLLLALRFWQFSLQQYTSASS